MGLDSSAITAVATAIALVVGALGKAISQVIWACRRR